jgi:TetR/AcrR family transcriptional regulator, fatty acid metabolism regulator protein
MDPNKRVRLLKAAIKIFAKNGFYKSRVEEIAKEAGVATGTTYLYFENKDDILISIFEEEMEPIISRLKQEIATKTTAKEKLQVFVKNHLFIVEESEDMAELLEVELRSSSKFMHGYQGNKIREYLGIVQQVVVEGQENNEISKNVNPVLFKQILFGAVDQIALTWTLSKSRKIPLSESAEQITNVLLNGILV